jgi:hypothetical protein
VINFTSNSASSGGSITDDGGAEVTPRGIEWSTTNNPTISVSTKTSGGAGNGSFSKALSGLSAGTIYYVWAYATNSAGTAYGNERSFTAAADLQKDIPAVDNNITAFMSTSNIPGASPAVSKNGKLVYMKGFGYAMQELALDIVKNSAVHGRTLTVLI